MPAPELHTDRQAGADPLDRLDEPTILDQPAMRMARFLPTPRRSPQLPPPVPPPTNVIPFDRGLQRGEASRATAVGSPAPTRIESLWAAGAPVIEAAPVAPPTLPQVAERSAPAPAVPATDARWAVFVQLGLGPKATPKQNTAKLLVSTYRALGFVVLSIIVVVLVGYIATSAFYFVSDSWIQPVVVSPTDEKVLSLKAQVVEHQNERDRITAELNQADRAIAVQQAFQAQFADAIRADLTGRKAALTRAREMAKGYAGARARIQSSNRAYASASGKQLSQEYAAGLIDRGAMLSGKFQLAQIRSANLSLAERQSEYEARATELEAEATALDAILTEKGGEGVLSYDVLRIKQEFEASRLETAKVIENREALRASLARQDAVLEGLLQAPQLRALADEASVAFVPYGNLDNVSHDAPLYACKLEMVICSRVGQVIRVLPGEVAFKHPQRDKVLRGQMVEIDLDGSAGKEDVLFVGGRPLFF